MPFSLFRSLLLFVLFSGFSYIAQAQIDTFDLSLYKRPDLVRHQLDLDFNFSNGADHEYNHSYSPDYNYQQETNNASLNSGIGGVYRGYFNSRKYQGNHRLGVGTSGGKLSRSTDRENETSSDIKSFGINLSARSINRLYFDGLYFVETDLQISNTRVDFHKMTLHTDTLENPVERTNEDRNFEGSLPILVGKGRVEPIQDARMAVYILDQLSRKGKLKRQPDQQEILAFAEEIASIKNERFFDARNRRIAEMTRLDSFLQNRNLIREEDMEYYTTMNDFWRYANNPSRGSGSRFSLGVEPGYDYVYRYENLDEPDLDMKTIEKNYFFELFGLIRYDYEKPINLYWQSSFHGNVRFGSQQFKDRTVTEDQETSDDRLLLDASAEYRLSWYPDSRSRYSFRILTAYDQVFSKEKSSDRDTPFSDEQYHLYSALSLDGYYYISPRVRLSGSISLQYQNNHRTTPDYALPPRMGITLSKRKWQYLTRLTLNYSLF
jgi:hypothetical protein